MHKDNQPLIFEITKEGRIGYSLPELDVPEIDLSDFCQKDLSVKKLRNFQKFPNLILCAITRHFQIVTMESTQAFIRLDHVR